MTALCGGGTSGPNPLSEAVVLVGSARLAQLLETSGVPWLVAAVPFLTLPPFILSSFCSADPPAMPTFTSAETNAILQVTIGADFFSGLTKLAALLANSVWTQECICTSGALTPPVYPTTPPAGTPIREPQITATACQVASGTATRTTSAGFTNLEQPSMAGLGGSSVTLTGQGAVAGIDSCTYGIRFMRTDNGLVLAGCGFTIAAADGSTTKSCTSAVPSGTDHVEVQLSAAGTTGHVLTFNWGISTYCGGDTPGAPPVACCVPDAGTQAILDAILAMVTLIQRQSVPFAYVTGAAHAGLTGNGAVAVHGLLGVRVDITTAPSRLGSAAGDPVALWDAGWINLGTADGFGQRVFITSNPLLKLGVSPAVTQVGYSIPGDVVVTITELVREP